MPTPIDARFHDTSLLHLKFSLEEYESRLEKTRELMRENDLDALIVHSHDKVMYLTGFETCSWWAWVMLIVPAEGDPVIVMDHYEATNAAFSSWLDPEQIFVYQFVGSDPRLGSPIEASVDLIKDQGLGDKRLGLDTSANISYERSLSYRMYDALRSELPDVDWVDLDDGIEQFMVVKSPAEIDRLRRSARFSVIGMQALYDATRVGATDNELAAAVMHALYAAGSEPMVLEPLISVGRRSGIFHTRWRNAVLMPGETVFAEIGGVYHRYSAPLMRTIVTEPGPDPDLEQLIEACIESVRITVDGMKPGVDGRELAIEATEPLRPYDEGFLADGNRAYSLEAGDIIWGAGGGMVSERLESVTLEAGMVLHVRAAVRDIGRRGVTFSDSVLVTETGTEVLTGAIPLEIVIR